MVTAWNEKICTEICVDSLAATRRDTRVEEAFEDQRLGLGKHMQDERVVLNGALRPRAIVSSFKSGRRRSREHSARAWEVLQQIALRFPLASRVVSTSCEATED